LLGDQRTVFRRLRAGNRKLRCDLKSLRALARQRLFQGGHVVGRGVAISIHAKQ